VSTDPERLYGKPWNEGEYVAVLDAYLDHHVEIPSTELPWVGELARTLGRTPVSVVMRLLNFVSLDPQQPDDRRGLDHGGPICENMFRRWHEQPRKYIAEVARVARQMVRPDPQMSLFSPLPVRIPKAFGRYEMMDRIGEGGFAQVFKVVDPAGEPAAMKVLKMDLVPCPEAFGRFRREIAAMKRVDHPHVLRLYEDNLGEECDYPALVMAYASCSLRQHLDRPREQANGAAWPVLGPAEAASIVRSVAEGAIALHSHPSRIIHRDITPNNVLLMPDGTWVLADFGLCKFLGPVTTSVSFSTGSGRGWGTEPYAAPEQWREFDNADERTDVYALGVLVWELFTSEGPPLDVHAHGLPQALADLFHRTHARSPAERVPSVSDFATEFDAALLADGLSG